MTDLEDTTSLPDYEMLKYLNEEYGVSLTDLGRLRGVSRQAVWDRFQKKGWTSQSRAQLISRLHGRNLIDLYQTYRVPARVLGELMGVSTPTMVAILKEWAIIANEDYRGYAKTPGRTIELIRKARMLGMSEYEIADLTRVKVSQNTVHNHTNDMEVQHAREQIRRLIEEGFDGQIDKIAQGTNKTP
jgi:hypothetical protein